MGTEGQWGRLPGGGNTGSNDGTNTRNHHESEVKKEKLERRHEGLPGRVNSLARCRELRGYMRETPKWTLSGWTLGITLPRKTDPAPPSPEFTGKITYSLSSSSTSYLCGSNLPNLMQWKIQMSAYLAGRAGSATQVRARIIRSIRRGGGKREPVLPESSQRGSEGQSPPPRPHHF